VDFSEPAEDPGLREAIGAVIENYSGGYSAERAAAHQPIAELWQDLGLPRVHRHQLPRRVRGLARLLRIAPVGRKMILNHVAQHSLSLPRPHQWHGDPHA
jgi:hypothetical protein